MVICPAIVDQGEDIILPRSITSQSCALLGEFIPAPDVLPFNRTRKIHQVAGGDSLPYDGWAVIFYKNAAATAKMTAGSILATFSFLPHTRLTPTQKIRIDPIMERFPSAASVISGRIRPANAVMLP